MSRLNLIDTFKNESAETFNKCSKAYELGRTDERARVIDEFVEYVKQYMWWSTQADEKVIGEFALGEYAIVFRNKLKEQK